MNIQEKVEEVNKQEDQFPKEGYKYYQINEFGRVYSSTWDKSDYDYCCLEIGNVFKTQKDAEFMIESLKVFAELRRLSRPFIAEERNWEINYHHSNKQIEIYDCEWYQAGIHYFDSEEDAESAIKKIGEDRLKKYYFMIEEGDEE